MRIVVIGGTGLAGRHTAEVLARDGHDVVIVARSMGIDLDTGEGLHGALAGAEAVIDAGNVLVEDADDARAVFGARTERLLAAEALAGVGHHVLLSILGVDRIAGNAHYAGKRRQEDLVRRGPVPWTIVRAAQFHEFAIQVVDWTLHDGVAPVAPALIHPVAAADVGAVLAEVAAGEPARDTLELAGPEPQDLFDMARRAAAAQGRQIRLVPSFRGVVSADMAGDVNAPGPGARLAPTTFDEWLAGVGRERGRP